MLKSFDLFVGFIQITLKFSFQSIHPSCLLFSLLCSSFWCSQTGIQFFDLDISYGKCLRVEGYSVFLQETCSLYNKTIWSHFLASLSLSSLTCWSFAWRVVNIASVLVDLTPSNSLNINIEYSVQWLMKLCRFQACLEFEKSDEVWGDKVSSTTAYLFCDSVTIRYSMSSGGSR